MLNNKSVAIVLSTLFIVFNSTIASAGDSLTSSIPIWPLIAFIIFVVIFRKQLNCIPPDNLEEKQTTPAEEPEITNNPSPAANEHNIDLTDGVKQCQAGTAKGTRCKRTSNLNETSLTIDDKTYQLIVCKQHNTKTLKPFSELLK